MIYSEKTALESLKNGDKRAYSWIYNKYTHQLHSYAAKIVGCMATAEDIHQDVFMKLWEERETMKITESLQAYLNTCVCNKWRDYIDHSKVKCKHQECFWDENKDAHESNNPETILIAKDTENKINDVINALPVQRRCIFFYVVERKTQK